MSLKQLAGRRPLQRLDVETPPAPSRWAPVSAVAGHFPKLPPTPGPVGRFFDYVPVVRGIPRDRGQRRPRT